ncbi:class I SAM-dependent methyltransferase [Aestuariibius insulae]|uniref:class I SAM-dependent methyltransferase n=1 Tax=Aestuariibius insulae TaxID=2058287 RepID=UPI00345EEB74
MWTRAFDTVMRSFIQGGALEITYADGHIARYGDPSEPIRITFSDPHLPRKILLSPDIAIGEAYMDGRVSIAQDDLRGFLQLVMHSRSALRYDGLMRWRNRLAGPVQPLIDRFSPLRSKDNVAHHYDLSSDLYDLFLDEDRQYSCAYFRDPGMTLEAAQEAKKHHIARKLGVRDGDRVLDIGCGWGGMALTLARDYGAHVTGVTLSEEQHAIARRRVEEAGLADRIDIRLMDYRDVTETFDRIVSVGMFEHVGRPQYGTYFSHIHDSLAEGGVALVHTIGNLTAPRATSPWIRKYVFPGGYLPSTSHIAEAVEGSGLMFADLEVLRGHYAQTLAHWQTRFVARIDEARTLYDERFCRMWRYYLTAAELGFLIDRLAVLQCQLVRDKSAVPATRDYLYSAA